MLALLLFAQYVVGKDTSKDPYIIKQVDSCPDVGYFFKRDLNLNIIEPSCHLCFCQENGTAICWPRENKRCDENSYYHAGRKKREIRSRRSPGFSDIFFRDAARDIFNKQTPEQCKPFESSFSEGCPPADWCTGCTVCDCDANGRWDCHILSFCPDNKGKKQMKKRRGSLRNKIMKRQLSTTKTIPKTTLKPTRKTVKKTNNAYKRKKAQIKQNKAKQINKKQRKYQKVKSKKITQSKGSKVPFQKKNVTKVKTKLNKKQIPKKPITHKSNKIKEKKGKSVIKPGKIKNANLNKNDSTSKFAHTILKKVMASVEKLVNESQKNFNKTTQPKMIQKQSMTKNYKRMNKNNGNKDKNKVQSKIINKINTKIWTKVSTKKANEKLTVNSRRKREITTRDEIQDMSNKFIYNDTIFNATKNYYYRYTVDLKNENETEHKNSLLTGRNDTSSTLDQITNNTEITTSQASEITLNNLQNSSKILNRVHQEMFREKLNSNISGSNFCRNDTSYKKNITCGKICDLKKIFRKLVFDFGKRNTTKIKAKVRNINILTNLKKVFRNIFLKNKINQSNLTVDKRVPFRKRNVIKTLCKNINSCKLNDTSKELRLKLDKLRAESFIILKSVRVIKGLLKLLDINEGDINSTFKRRQFTDNDLKKLNIILKDEYDAKYGLVNLTETQRIQIKYIKENTLVFIQSIEKFANILNDILYILTNGNKQILAHNYHRRARNQRRKISKSETINDKLEKLKKLLINYNLVQNKFMKQMYDVLNTLGAQGKNATEKMKINKVSAQNEKSNYTVAVENYIKNILKNLRKLKELAEKLSSKYRKKRAIMENDDAIEYLLMLMEYLFKQNKPLDISPVNDGIDLLIDAIENAPDIKTTKKKKLNNNLINIKKTEVVINSRRNNEIMDENNVLEKKIKTFESIDEEHEDLNKYINSSTFENFNQEEVTNHIDVLNKESKHFQIQNNNNLDEKMLNVEKEDIKRFEVFIDDTDEDDTAFDTTNTVIVKEATPTERYELPVRTSFPDKKEIKSTNNYEANDSENKTKLDWIEENYNNEEQREKITEAKETTTQKNQLATRTIKIAADKYADPISSISQEIDERRYKNNAEYNKKMNLLNSLNYATEKTFSESESKEDKYNVESFPLYFV